MNTKERGVQVMDALDQVFQWEGNYHCKHCGVKGYYTEHDHDEDVLFCVECGHNDFFEFYDMRTPERMLARESDLIIDAYETLWSELSK
jgi:hypothetical protein